VPLPPTASQYRAFHRSRGLATSSISLLAYYSFTTDSDALAELTENLQPQVTDKEIDHHLNWTLKYLPEPFAQSPTLDGYDCFKATNRSPGHFRFILRNPKSEHTILIAYKPPK
jgi:hypothetical protein